VSAKPTLKNSARILADIDAKISYGSDFSAQYTITQDKPALGITITKAVMFRRDRDDKYLILIAEPAQDKGKGYLKIAGNMWLYDPVARRFTITSTRDKFQDTNASVSDFTQSSLAKEYRIVSQAQASLGVFKTNVYELEATVSSANYPLRKIWVDEDLLVRKAEDYSLSGQLMRTIAIPSYQRLGSQYVAISIVIIDALAGQRVNGQFKNERTVVSVAQPSFATVPDIVFTQSYLERMSQ
jgi:outer membrane lipoprotein-sorting protein